MRFVMRRFGKIVLAVTLSTVLMLSMVGCGESDKKDTNGETEKIKDAFPCGKRKSEYGFRIYFDPERQRIFTDRLYERRGFYR